ncbi:hypothetical protein [Arthrobacter sp. 7Tela_A1]|uniref:hypothetical protein n=1 Tax=Arthrobacter sp. 7Tela_A1 TaxID=3093745 RepID=UPI003BB7010F
MPILNHPADAVLYAPDIPRSYEPERDGWDSRAPLTVSLLLHAPRYLDPAPPGTFEPLAMQGGVGRETGEPKPGQVARLSQWDFGLTTGIFRLLDIAERHGVAAAVALDAHAAALPGLGAALGMRAGEIVARGAAANSVLDPRMDEDAERAYITTSLAAVEEATGRKVTGWFSPERTSTPRTTSLLAAEGVEWFGDWTLDEVPVPLQGSAGGLTALPFSLETEDMFALYSRGLPFEEYEGLLEDTVDQLVADARTCGNRFLGLSWFGWVLGQACFADVAETVLGRLAVHPDVVFALPGSAAAAGGGPAGENTPRP